MSESIGGKRWAATPQPVKTLRASPAGLQRSFIKSEKLSWLHFGFWVWAQRQLKLRFGPGPKIDIMCLNGSQMRWDWIGLRCIFSWWVPKDVGDSLVFFWHRHSYSFSSPSLLIKRYLVVMMSHDLIPAKSKENTVVFGERPGGQKTGLHWEVSPHAPIKTPYRWTTHIHPAVQWETQQDCASKVYSTNPGS